MLIGTSGNSSRRGRKRCSALIVAAAVAGILPAVARATDSTWTKNGDGNWGDTSNWSAGVPNAIGDIATFAGAISLPHTINQNVVGGVTLGLLVFYDTPRYTISGEQIIIDAPGTASGMINDYGSHTISSSLDFPGPSQIAVNGTGQLTFSGIVYGALGGNSLLLNTAATASLTLSGMQTNVLDHGINMGVGNLHLAKTSGAAISSGTLEFGSNNVNVSNPARVYLDHGANIGSGVGVTINHSGTLDGGENFTQLSGPLTLDGGAIVNANLRVTNSDITINGASGFASSISGTADGLHGLDFFGQTRSINVANAAQLNLDAPVTNGGILKSGLGYMIMTASNNTYTGPTSVNSAGGTLELQCSITSTSGVSVYDQGTLRIADSGSRVIKTPSLSFSGSGILDLRNNKLILTSQSKGSFDGAHYDGVSGSIESGRNHGTWDGAGIVTQRADAGLSDPKCNVAVATAGEVGKTTFAGISVSPADVLVMYTWNGDANLDGKVNADDYFQIDSHYNKTDNASKSWFNGDFNYDGQINGDDYFIIDNGFQNQGAPFSSAPALGGVSAVPEPAMSLIPIAFAAMFYNHRRARRAR